MKWWAWVGVFIFITSVIVVLAVVLPTSLKGTVKPTPPTSTTPFPFPSLTTTPRYGKLLLLYDTFDGPINLPLTEHAPNEPSGVFWTVTTDAPEYSCLLNGSGAASNLISLNPSPTLTSYDGANKTTGQFITKGYNPTTDALSFEVHFSVPTVTPVPDGDILFEFQLGRSTPTQDRIVFVLNYNVTAQTWSCAGTSEKNISLPNTSKQTIFDIGTQPVTTLPLAPAVIIVSMTIYPDGNCIVNAPSLNINNLEGPSSPNIIPASGDILHYFAMLVGAVQLTSSIATPLNAQIHSIRVESTYQL
jgi:hypothetical protein